MACRPAGLLSGGKFTSDVAAHPNLQRFVFVVEGSLSVTCADGPLEMKADDFAFFPPGYSHELQSSDAKLVIYEKQFVDVSEVVSR